MSSEPLAEFFATHQRLRDCLTIARRAVDREDLDLLDGTDFIAAPRRQAAEWIGQVEKDADDLAVVAIWAWFERYLIEYAKLRAELVGTSTPPAFAQELKARVTRQIEYWRIDEVLDAFKSIVEANRIGIAKQVKDYRDWIAHRNPNRPRPARTEPTAAYSLLAAIIDAIEQAR
jgi:hypothetical protein